jgi:hypothetical protein
MSYGRLVCNLIFKWWSRPSALFNRTNIIHMTTSVRMIKYNMFACLMVFNATFNNISFISWWSVLLVEETRGPGENHWPVASLWQTLSHNVVHFALIEIRTYNISGDRAGNTRKCTCEYYGCAYQLNCRRGLVWIWGMPIK